MEIKNLQLERTVFFCDAVVAIAITLLALGIKIEHPSGSHLNFTDISHQWKTFAAFVLSFINIASFWKTHHAFFSHIKKVDEKLLWFNIFWLFFLVLLPFSTTLVSTYFFDTAAIFTYSINMLAVAIFQNMIWDYTSLKPDEFLNTETLTKSTVAQLRLFCNLDMMNIALAAIAFILLITKLPIILGATLFFRKKFREIRAELKNEKKSSV